MAKSKTSSVVIAPSAPQAAVEPTRKTRKRRARKPQYCAPGSSKPARGLLATPADFNRAKQRLTVGQFGNMSAWYAHCAEMAQQRADNFAALAVDAQAHPEKYGRAKRLARVATLQAQLDVLTAALAARGMSAQEIASLTADIDAQIEKEASAADIEDVEDQD